MLRRDEMGDLAVEVVAMKVIPINREAKVLLVKVLTEVRVTEVRTMVSEVEAGALVKLGQMPLVV